MHAEMCSSGLFVIFDIIFLSLFQIHNRVKLFHEKNNAFLISLQAWVQQISLGV